MPLEDQIGLTGPQYDADIERGKILEFARAMGAPISDFCSSPNPVIPGTFLVSIPYTWGYTLERPRGTVFETIDHDLTVSLHAQEEFIFHGAPPRAGEQLVVQPSLTDVRKKAGKTGGQLVFLEITTRYSDKAGILRAEQKTTSVTTEQTPGNDEWSATLPQYDPEYAELEPSSIFDGVSRQKFTDLVVGAGPGTIAAVPLSLRDIVRFQAVVGEDDPLHYDYQWAAKNGYPSVFALGMHQASQMAAYAAYWLPPENLRRFKVRFHNMSWPGDRFLFEGQTEKLDTEEKTADIRLTCHNQDGVLINEVWADYDFGENGE